MRTLRLGEMRHFQFLMPVLLLAAASLPLAVPFVPPRVPAAGNGGHRACAKNLLRHAPCPFTRHGPVPLAANGNSAWWEQRGSVPFSCTECGKCCQVRGDVWASPEDAIRLAEHLKMSTLINLGGVNA